MCQVVRIRADRSHDVKKKQFLKYEHLKNLQMFKEMEFCNIVLFCLIEQHLIYIYICDPTVITM